MDPIAVAFPDAEHGFVAGNIFEGDDPLSNKFKGSILLRTADGGVI
jgi:hypothetical protein